MPEFILDHGTAEASRQFKTLDGFTRGYIEAMFWTDASSPDDGDLADATVAMLAPEAWARITADCEAFQRDNAGDLAGYYWERDTEHAGHDFWLTRNGHGAGFWDRETSKDGIGCTKQTLDNLTNAAHAFGEIDLYRGDDGLIYFS